MSNPIAAYGVSNSFDANLGMASSYRVTISAVNSRTSQQIPVPSLIPPSPSGEYVAIIVEPGLWATGIVQTAINQYRTDLNNTGYNTILYNSFIANAPTLRGLLQNWYSTNNIVGAVLLGNLPYIRYYHPANGSHAAETFVCDLYYMDLDGSWYDTNTDGIYDRHNSSSGADIYPEIYVGRIDASSRTLGGTVPNEMVAILNRIHSYRIGGVSRTHQALTYIDDDWQSWADGTFDNWPGWLDNAYPTRTDVHTPTSWTNASDWLNNRIVQDYEWAHLCAHSGAGPGMHYFGPGGSGEGTVSSAQIDAQTPTINFFNLFCCSGANWLTADSLATTYLFSGSHTVGVIGTTKTGGMLGGSSFYNSISQNDTIGKALETWFQGIKSYTTYYLEWFYGMTILGDPFLTIHYDITVLTPTITSSTHPNPSQWSTNPNPQFNWTVPPDVNGIAGYYYILDHNPSTVPTAATGSFTTVNGTLPTTALSDGTWYLHVVAKDTAGNVGSEAAHYQVNIDATDPVVTINFPIDGATVSSDLTLLWSVVETGSGYSSANIYVNDSLSTTVSAPLTNTTLSGLPLGTYPLNVTVFDVSGRSGSHQITIVVGVPPAIPGFPFGAIALGAILALSLGVIYRRRQH
ncbi:MAG: C25 family cysteine peptidase [Candidatus Thorarchaeota archaeon]